MSACPPFQMEGKLTSWVYILYIFINKHMCIYIYWKIFVYVYGHTKYSLKVAETWLSHHFCTHQGQQNVVHIHKKNISTHLHYICLHGHCLLIPWRILASLEEHVSVWIHTNKMMVKEYYNYSARQVGILWSFLGTGQPTF